MINSMTGYGRAAKETPACSCQVEVKSVNNRSLKIVLHLPEAFSACEVDLESIVRQRIERGSVTINVSLTGAAISQAAEVNQDVVSHYIRSLADAADLCKERNIPCTLDLSQILALPGACQNRTISSEEELACRELIVSLSNEALDRMLQMRRREGEVLWGDLSKHLDEIRAAAGNIRQQAPQVSRQYHERLKQRVNQLVSDAKMSLSDSDLLREVALFSDRSDISEELSRLFGHLDHFVEVAGQSSQVGRTLEFIAQEMLREANTLGSKCSDGQITRWVVQIKGCIDRIKEQVQNVE
jgi:uncharacterized protein (TIGR00255 family)